VSPSQKIRDPTKLVQIIQRSKLQPRARSRRHHHLLRLLRLINLDHSDPSSRDIRQDSLTGPVTLYSVLKFLSDLRFPVKSLMTKDPGILERQCYHHRSHCGYRRSRERYWLMNRWRRAGNWRRCLRHRGRRQAD
jgi:hypothetical protein